MINQIQKIVFSLIILLAISFANNTSLAQICEPVVIVDQPIEQIACQGSNVVLSVRAVIADNSNLTYEWMKDGMPISVETNSSADEAILYLNDITHHQSGVYTCKVTNICSESVSSNTVLVSATRNTEIMDLTQNVEVLLGETAMLSFTTHANGITPNSKIAIQWYKGTVALKNDNRFAGVNSSILTIRNIVTNDFASDYWVVAQGLCSADTATGITLTQKVTPVITVDAIANTTECVGKSVTMTATATMNVAGTLNYQWRANGTPLTNNAKHNGVTTNTLTVNNLDAADNATKYDVVVTSSDGKTTATSNEASVVVKPLATLSAKSNDVISVEAGKEINLSVTMASTLTLNYQWYVDNGSGTPTIITGATTNNLVIAAAAAADAGTYSVTVKSECDDQNITVSEVAVTMAGGANSVERGNLDLNITPNPTSEILNLNLSNIDYTSITITNTLGEVLFTTTNQTKVLNINVNELSLSNGIYLINVIGNKNYTGKFVVNK